MRRRDQMTNAQIRTEDRTGHKAWEVWSAGDDYDGPMYIAAYKDKGEAERHMRRLKRSHPYVRYYLKHRRVAARHLFGGTRATRRGKKRFSKRMGY